MSLLMDKSAPLKVKAGRVSFVIFGVSGSSFFDAVSNYLARTTSCAETICAAFTDKAIGRERVV